MEPILQTLMDLGGVNAALVFDSAGRLLGHTGRAIYDRALCEQFAADMVKSLEAIQLQQEDWDTITAQYQDGKLVLRKVGSSGDQVQVLAVIADGSLNPSFATVAIRVAAGKLKKLQSGASASSLMGTPPPAAVSGPLADSRPLSDSRPSLAHSGTSWSGSSSVAFSRVQAADPASGAFLARCAKELAQYVGPMSKVFVEEGVRRVSPEAPFALSMANALIEDLSGQIEDPSDRKKFQKAIRS